MTTCRHCGAVWTGTKIEHCTECHRTFAGSEPGDSHRVGDHAACRTEDEMHNGGMWTTTNPYDTQIWHGRVGKKNVEPRRNPRHRPATTTQTAEQVQTPTLLPPREDDTSESPTGP